jgi:hypothetical protein
MRLISFELTMPNVASWNGKWTGADNKYYVVEKISDRYLNSKDHFKELLENGKDIWHYNFGDGWGANVKAEIVDASEAKKRRKVSKGFCGYEWMITSIKYYGEIMNSAQQKRHIQSQSTPA